MAVRRWSWMVIRLVVPALLGYGFVSSCQSGPVRSQAAHRPTPIGGPANSIQIISVNDLKVRLGIPAGWQAMPLEQDSCARHQQWNSESGSATVGVAYVRLPWALSAQAFLDFARRDIEQRMAGARLLRRWTDALGREWFEAEQGSQRMTGYAVTQGRDGWISYRTHKGGSATTPEQELAVRCLDSVLPQSAVVVVSSAAGE